MDRLGRDRNARHRTALTADGHSAGFPPGLRTPDHIARAEELGYRRAWCYDAPAVVADIWMTLARAADRTRRIGLGTAVAIPDYRHLMTTAAAAAQAPGRVAVGAGAGPRAVDRLPGGAQYRASIERELTAFPRMAGIGGSHD